MRSSEHLGSINTVMYVYIYIGYPNIKSTISLYICCLNLITVKIFLNKGLHWFTTVSMTDSDYLLYDNGTLQWMVTMNSHGWCSQR